jgi:putative membrane protein
MLTVAEKGEIMWFILLVAIAVGAYFLWKNPKLREDLKSNIQSQFGESAIDILKKRYAKGEISEEEFERMKNELEK